MKSFLLWQHFDQDKGYQHLVTATAMGQQCGALLSQNAVKFIVNSSLVVMMVIRDVWLVLAGREVSGESKLETYLASFVISRS